MRIRKEQSTLQLLMDSIKILPEAAASFGGGGGGGCDRSPHLHLVLLAHQQSMQGLACKVELQRYAASMLKFTYAAEQASSGLTHLR